MKYEDYIKKLRYQEALIAMKTGIKVKQNNFIYFLGKSDREQPYTLIIKKNKIPIVKKGFKSIEKAGFFQVI
jgi:hypothetical protein